MGRSWFSVDRIVRCLPTKYRSALNDESLLALHRRKYSCALKPGGDANCLKLGLSELLKLRVSQAVYSLLGVFSAETITLKKIRRKRYGKTGAAQII